MQRFREPVNGFTHLIGVPLGALGLLLLVIETHHAPDKMLSMIVYGISIMLLYSASAMYHLIKASPQIELYLRRVDHAAIYIMIAGTYTPIIYNVLNGGWRWGFLGLIWALAVTGIVYKLVFLRYNINHLSTLLYVGMGWLAIFITPVALPLMAPGAVALILAGGVVYTVGAVVFAVQKPNFHRYFGHHELWHLFVLGGSALHFIAIALYIA